VQDKKRCFRRKKVSKNILKLKKNVRIETEFQMKKEFAEGAQEIKKVIRLMHNKT